MVYSFFSVSLIGVPHIMQRIVILVFPLSRRPFIFRFVSPHFGHVSGSWIRMGSIIFLFLCFFYCGVKILFAFDYVSFIVAPLSDYLLGVLVHGVLSWLFVRWWMKAVWFAHVSARVYPHSTAMLDSLCAWPIPKVSMVLVNGFLSASLSFARIFTIMRPTALLLTWSIYRMVNHR